ncbi:Hsp70 protein-domain-containing protein [Cladochytrium replicatum]|nr:Hsp70 protein-domain-containing protein [Cladochytrium replicatum]
MADAPVRRFIGVSFGTFNSSIAIIGKEGSTDVIANEDGDRNIPSYVAFTSHEELAGSQAKVQAISNMRNTIVQFRSLLGKRCVSVVENEEGVRNSEVFPWRFRENDEEVQEHSRKLPMDIIFPEGSDIPVYQVEIQPIDDENGDAEPTISTFTAEEITTKYFRKLKETAESFIGGSVDGCVVSAPVHFSDDSTNSLIKAISAAGFEEVYPIAEPVAAALAFENSKSAAQKDEESKAKSLDKTILTLDLGGHQFNATLLRYSDGLYSVLASVDDIKLGGVHFDEILVNHCADEFRRKTKMDVRESRRALLKLRAACETTKRSLSRIDVAPCSVESLHEGMDFNSNVNRGRFEMLADPLFTRCKTTINNVLKEGGVTADEVDEVLLVGGSARMPKFQSVVKSTFSKGKTVVRTDVEPDEAIASGCAVQANVIVNTPYIDYSEVTKDPKIVTLPSVKQSIGLAAADGGFVAVLPKGTPVPVKRSIELGGAPDQKEFFVALYEGEAGTTKENALLAQIIVSTADPALDDEAEEVQEKPKAPEKDSKDQKKKKGGKETTPALEENGKEVNGKVNTSPPKQVILSLLIEKDGVLNVIAVEKGSGRTLTKVKLDHISK